MGTRDFVTNFACYGTVGYFSKKKGVQKELSQKFCQGRSCQTEMSTFVCELGWGKAKRDQQQRGGKGDFTA
jgi:RAB protein geranylgeranyltransferase component A